MCNAVAKLNDLRKSDEFDLPDKRGKQHLAGFDLPDEGVPIPDDFYIPNKGFVALGHSDGDACHCAKQKARKMH